MSGKATNKTMDSFFLDSPFHQHYCDSCCFYFEYLSYSHHLFPVVAVLGGIQGMSCAGLAMGQYNLYDIYDYMAFASLQTPAQTYLCRQDSVNQNEDASVQS